MFGDYTDILIRSSPSIRAQTTCGQPLMTLTEIQFSVCPPCRERYHDYLCADSVGMDLEEEYEATQSCGVVFAYLLEVQEPPRMDDAG